MDKCVELVGALEPFELLVASPVQQVLAVGDVGRVRQLEGAFGEPRVRWAEAEEPDKHLLPPHGAVEESQDLLEPCLALHRVYAPAQLPARRQEHRSMLLVPGLVVVAVEVDRVALHRESLLLAVVEG